ncbi:MAG: hypothetical protein ABI555_06760 [Chloroflexota bacterium]
MSPLPERPHLLGEEGLAEPLDRPLQAAAPRAIVAGWATVDLDRAQTELAAPSGLHAVPADAPPDPHLGAHARTLGRDDGSDSPAPALILLEPSTEGLLAAALARHGEGYVALYLLADSGAAERVRGAGFSVTGERSGPLGPQRLVRTSSRFGPFVVLVTRS